MTISGPRIAREQKTIAAMIEIFCRQNHDCSSGRLCDECTELLEYARKRLQFCPHQEVKPTCGNCTKHCYKKEMQDKVKEVMRYSGPRMAFYHPLLAFYHLLDNYLYRNGKR